MLIIGERIKMLRESHNISQAALAKRLGITTCAVADPASAFQWNLLMQDADYHLLSFLDWQDTLPLTAQALPHGLR